VPDHLDKIHGPRPGLGAKILEFAAQKYQVKILMLGQLFHASCTPFHGTAELGNDKWIRNQDGLSTENESACVFR
jgi:hypothetical protein